MTGLNGFIGGPLAARLGDLRLLGVGTAPQSARPVARYLPADLRRPGALAPLRDEPVEWIIHLAGRSRGSEPELFETNVRSVELLLEEVERSWPRARVILLGSAAEYGRLTPSELPAREEGPARPESPYGQSKLAMTRAALSALERGLDVRIVRLFNVLGPGQSEHFFVGAILKRLQAGLEASPRPVLSVGNIDVGRDFVDLEDVVEGLRAAMLSPAPAGIYNLASGRSVQLRDVLTRLRRLTGIEFELARDPALLRGDDILDSYGCTRRAKEWLGFEARTELTESLSRMIAVMGLPVA